MPPSAGALSTIRQFQSETDAIRETGEPIGQRWTVRTLALFLAACIALSFVLTLDRVVTSTGGKIVSTETVSVFQPLETSIIKTVNVKAGQEVQKGQILATLDSTFATADVGQLRQQVASLDAQIARTEAELSSRAPDFSNLKGENQAKHVQLQQSLYNQRQGQYLAQIRSFDAKISQTNATIVKLQAEEGRYREREKISHQIETMRQTLIEKQAGSLLNLLLASDQRLDLLRMIENQHNSLLEAQQTVTATMADRAAFEQQWLATTSQELVTARNQRDTAVAELSKAEKHQDLVQLIAPEPSVVLEIARLSIGSVLKIGDPFITLMPLRVPVEAEVNISTRDVGFVRPGDEVSLKIDAFDFLKHGVAKGTVRWISEDSFFTDDAKKPVDAYYRARVRIESSDLNQVPPNFRLIPGMTLVADVKVGQRSVAQYIFGGMMRGYSEAMRER